MSAWSLLSSQPTPPMGSEQWTELSIPITAGVVAYGFRLVVPLDFPVSWNTLGYFGVAAGYNGARVVFPTRPIVGIGRGLAQAIQVITPSDSEYPPILPDSVAVNYFVHQWVDASAAEIWGLS